MYLFEIRLYDLACPYLTQKMFYLRRLCAAGNLEEVQQKNILSDLLQNCFSLFMSLLDSPWFLSVVIVGSSRVICIL